jgi:hypothetical protein
MVGNEAIVTLGLLVAAARRADLVRTSAFNEPEDGCGDGKLIEVLVCEGTGLLALGPTDFVRRADSAS